MRTEADYKTLERIAANKESEDAKTADEFIQKLESSEYAWGLAYRILENTKGIRLPKN